MKTDLQRFSNFSKPLVIIKDERIQPGGVIEKMSHHDYAAVGTGVAELPLIEETADFPVQKPPLPGALWAPIREEVAEGELAGCSGGGAPLSPRPVADGAIGGPTVHDCAEDGEAVAVTFFMPATFVDWATFFVVED